MSYVDVKSLLSKEEKNEVLAHFPPISREVIDYATDKVLGWSRYIFVTNGKLNKKGYCTHCHARFYVEDVVKQNLGTTCPYCESKCKYRKAWVGRKYMTDSGMFLWFEKSVLDPNVLLASWIHCSRKYSDSYEEVETKCVREDFFVFKMGGSYMYTYSNYYGTLVKNTSVYNRSVHKSMNVAVSSLFKAATGTPFEYSRWQNYSMWECVKYLALYSEMPNVELLSKNGFSDIVKAKMEKVSLYRSINWKAWKLHDFFRLSKADLKMMQESGATGYYVMNGPYFALGLRIWQLARREKSKLIYEDIINFCESFDMINRHARFAEIKKYTTIHRMYNYLNKQFKLDKKHYREKAQAMITWADYIKDCLRLDLDLSDDVVLFPKNLKLAHERTIELVEIKENKLTNARIKKRYKTLTPYIFESDGLMIRPPLTFSEITHEGRVLKHCVGGYAEKHSKGMCTILFIRDVKSPEEPYYTLEIKDTRIIQVRGLRNKATTPKVENFVKKFESYVLKDEKEVSKSV